MVEIIPKPVAKIPWWFHLLFYSSIALLIAAISSFFILNHLIKKSEDTLQDLEEVLARGKTPSEITLEKEILDNKKKIEDFPLLLNSHRENSNFFNFFENLCHPKVWFSSLNFHSQESRVEVSGQTESFQTLHQQLLIFKEEKLTRNVNLSGVSIGRDGEISFTLSLLLDPQIFTPK